MIHNTVRFTPIYLVNNRNFYLKEFKDVLRLYELADILTTNSDAREPLLVERRNEKVIKA